MIILPLLLLTLIASCQQQLPERYQEINALPPIYPDYANVTIPVNIAPLNFELLADVDAMMTRFSAEGMDIIVSGQKARLDIDEWKSLTANAAGKDISVEVFTEKDGQWARFKPFAIHVSKDAIDPWMSFRLISPSYVSYEELTLSQRCLEDFHEEVFVDNMLCSTEFGGQCVNCHSFQQYNPQRMQFHARENNGGTIIAYDGQLQKINMQHDSLLSAGVYPAWHPALKLIAYSTDKTIQSFHTAHSNKIEVLDTQSDLILYDIEKNIVTTIERQPDELEVFPAWSPDGGALYFSSAHFKYEAGSPSSEEILTRASEVKYNIYRKDFNLTTRQFGKREMLFCADTIGCSATLPRLSPDGKWMLFTLAASGCFPIWHHEADLWLMNTATGEARPLDECNSPDTESYHSWSSNSRWIVFSSRRHDGVFTRPFIAHIDNKGQASKPFELPTRDPDYHLQLTKSYNVPELMKGSVTISPQTFASKLKEDGIAVSYLPAKQ